MLTENQKVAANTYAQAMVKYEYERQQKHWPERWLTVTDEQKKEYETDWREDAEKLAELLLTKEGLYSKLLVGTFHPSNKNSRRLLESLYDVKLPPQNGMTREVVRELIGHDFINEKIRIQTERIEQEERERQEKEEKEFQSYIEPVLERIKRDECVNGDELLNACKHLEIDVPIRTKGAFSRIQQINSYQSRSYATRAKNPLPSSCYKFYRTCRQILLDKENEIK